MMALLGGFGTKVRASAGLLALGVVLAGGPAGFAAAPAKDKREMDAREAYAAGKYKEALDLFVKLYAETVHPNYLRNIGRCYQNLNEPDRALSSFREYLRKARGLSAREREEIRGYMKEMEDLKRQKEAVAAPANPPPPPPPPQPTPPVARTEEPVKAPPAAADPPPAIKESTPDTHPQVLLTGGAPPPPRDEESSIYTRWWFWGIVGGVIAAGVIGGVLASRSSPREQMCVGTRACDP